jgi:hypothetical protein
MTGLVEDREGTAVASGGVADQRVLYSTDTSGKCAFERDSIMKFSTSGFFIHQFPEGPD